MVTSRSLLRRTLLIAAALSALTWLLAPRRIASAGDTPVSLPAIAR
jgi:hypothetical protein